jgi:hypothetical protein
MRIYDSAMLQIIVKILRNTHRHPVNQALHSIGAPFYAVGLAMTLGHLLGMHTNLYVGCAMLLSAIGMFVLGHKIEGNIRSMAPLLLFRFLMVSLSRKVACYPFTKRVHLLRT